MIKSNKKNYYKAASDVINTEILSLQKLKQTIKSKSFYEAVKTIVKCKYGKIIFSGVGKSGIIARKISSTFASIGIPSFFLDAGNASHGDMGQISSNDVLILISLSGETNELKNIVEFASRNKKITLIGITASKNSLLYKNSDIKILLPKVKEAGPGNIVPTSSTIVQLGLGDAMAITCMKIKNFSKLDFKKFHPSGSLSVQLKTVEDLMIKGKKIPFINENQILNKALKIISSKKLGVLIVRNSKGAVSGIITDGDLRRITQKNKFIHSIKIKKIMTRKPKSIDKDTLAAKALEIMNTNKITSLCVYNKYNKKKIIGIIHIHNILDSSIS